MLQFLSAAQGRLHVREDIFSSDVMDEFRLFQHLGGLLARAAQ